jgi:hypothetical protein
MDVYELAIAVGVATFVVLVWIELLNAVLT